MNKTYIGVSLHLTDDGWSVQSLDSSGLGQQAGIKIGDTPLIINGQPANDFLQVYEHQKQCLGITITDIVVLNNTGQTISVNVADSTPPTQYIIEIIPYIIVCFIFWLTAFYVFIKKPRKEIAISLFLCSLIFGLVISGNVASATRIPVAVHLAIIATSIGPWVLLHFFLILPEERVGLRKNKYLYLIYLPAVITLLLYPFIGYANGRRQWDPFYRALELVIGL